MPFAMATRSGTTPSCVAGEPVAGAREAGLDLVGDEHCAVVGAPPGQRRQESRSRYDEPALALDRLDHHAGDVVGTDLLLDEVEGTRGGLLAGHAGRVAERVGHRDPVDLRRERPERLLVGHVLRGQCHREVGAAVVAVVEHDHGLPLGVCPGDLHGVLDGLGAGVEQRSALLVVAGGQPVQGLAHLDVLHVGRDHEAGVREPRDLLLNPGHHGVGCVAHAGHRDARPEVDQRVAVDIDEHAAARAVDEHRQRGPDPAGHHGIATAHQGRRSRAGNRRDEASLLGQAGTTEVRHRV